MSLAGVAGNHGLIAALWHELESRPSHGYLFSGRQGIGKATIALGFAHGMLCERAPGPDFCCTPGNCPVRQAPASGRTKSGAAPAPRCDCCTACVQIAVGVHPDFNSVARAPSRSDVLIEQVRDLIVRLGIKPARGRRRLAIIDDAETLNLPAQQALLKTLEEPPGQTIIFLICANERALLDTIRSRLRMVRFAPLEAVEIAELLIARGGIEPERAAVSARLARGSLSRALSLAEGNEPPSRELIEALGRAKTLDFVRAQALSQEFFAARDQAADNFELIARLLQEMLCFKLLRAAPDASSPQTAKLVSKLAGEMETLAILDLLDRALRAHTAIDAMANPRLQAEQWWMTAGAIMRGASPAGSHVRPTGGERQGNKINGA